MTPKKPFHKTAGLCSLQVPPWPLFRAGRALAARLPLVEARLAPPHAHVLGVAGAFFNSKALHAATKLGVADALRGGPLPVRQCLGASKGHPAPMQLLLALRSKPPSACQHSTTEAPSPSPTAPPSAPQIGQLAAAVGAQPDKLQRVLRLLVNPGIFRETRPGGRVLSTMMEWRFACR